MIWTIQGKVLVGGSSMIDYGVGTEGVIRWHLNIKAAGGCLCEERAH